MCCCSARPGWARTTLSHIIAAELGVNLRQTSGPVLEKPKDLAALLTNLERTTFFHRRNPPPLSPVVEEILYPALEDHQIDIMIGEGQRRAASSWICSLSRWWAPPPVGMLTNPLRDRFGIVARLEFLILEDWPASSRSVPGLLNAPMDRGGSGDRPPLARHAAHCQPAAAPGARLCRGQGDGRITKSIADKALAMLDGPAGLRRDGP